MKPRCNSCKLFFEGITKTQLKVIYDMKVVTFDGFCKIIRSYGTPFFFAFRNKTDTCEKWKWQGKKKEEN